MLQMIIALVSLIGIVVAPFVYANNLDNRISNLEKDNIALTDALKTINDIDRRTVRIETQVQDIQGDVIETKKTVNENTAEIKELLKRG